MNEFRQSKTETLVLPKQYVELQEDEMMYLDGEGWIANTFAVVGGAVLTVGGALLGAAAAGHLSVSLPFIGPVALKWIGGINGAVSALFAGTKSAYDFGRWIETELLGWD